MRWASAHRIPVVPRGAGSGLSGGATALDDGIVRVDGEDARHRRRPRHAHRDLPARTVQRRGEEGGRGARVVVSAGPVVVRDLQHRRQHRHQRGRAVLRQVRRHHRLRARTAGGAGRRDGGAARRPQAERRCGTESYEALRRQRGHPRHRHRDHAAAAAQATPVAAPWWPTSPRSRRPPTRCSASPARCGRRCWSSWTPSRSTPSRTS